MIALAVVLITLAVFAFFWAVNNKQFDDLESPGIKVLLDDDNDALMQETQKKHLEHTNQITHNDH